MLPHFVGFPRIESVPRRGGRLRARVKASQLILSRHEELADGSYLATIYPGYHDRIKDRNGRTVRIVETPTTIPIVPVAG